MLNSLKAVAILGLLVMLGGGPAFGEPAALWPIRLGLA